MTSLALWLIAVGLADLVRAGGVSARLTAPLGTGALVALAALSGFHEAHEWVIAMVLGVLAGLWEVLAARAEAEQGGGHRRALAVLAAGAAVAIAFSGWGSMVAGPLRQWLESIAWLDSMPFGVSVLGHPQGLLMVAGILLVNLSTANSVVRLVLVSTGAIPPVDPAQVGPPTGSAPAQLRGGRLLGSMERLLIVGLGLAGQLTAAGLVIAAKGIIRFPELQSKHSDTESVSGVGIDQVTEYFLVGSFVSWLFALGSLTFVL